MLNYNKNLPQGKDCIVIENLFDSYFNQLIINNLFDLGVWKLSTDHYREEESVDLSKYSDTGFVMRSFDTTDDVFKQDGVIDIPFFKVSADFIFNKVKSILELTNVEPCRVLWNYYNRSSTGVYHVDNSEDNYYSLLYNLHSSDGGTIINDSFYQSKEGTALLFKSSTLHKGVGPTKNNQRFAVNIIFKTEENKK